MKKNNILITGIDSYLIVIIKEFLILGGYVADTASFCFDIKEKFDSNKYNLFITEQSPISNELCTYIEMNQINLPILFIDAHLKELLYKRANNKNIKDNLCTMISSLLEQYDLMSPITTINNISYNRITDEVFVDDLEIRLTSTENKILKILINNPDKIFSKEELLLNI